MEEKLKKLAKIFSCLPPVLIRGTLYRDDVNGDVEKACQQLHKFQAMENSKDMFQTAVGGKGSTGTRREKSSTVADFRGKINHDKIPKDQVEVKELRNLTTDSCSDLHLEQNGGYQSNQDQITKPRVQFKERPVDESTEGPRGGLAQSQRSTQGFKDRDIGICQGWDVGLGHGQKPKTKSRGRGLRGRGRGFQDVNQLGGQQNQGKRGLHGGKAAQSSWQSVYRGLGQGGLGRAQSLSDVQSACHPEAIEQSRFQQNQLLVSGLGASTTEDCLVNFIEAMSGGEVEDVMMRNDKALVTMANDITGKSCQSMTSQFI